MKIFQVKNILVFPVFVWVYNVVNAKVIKLIAQYPIAIMKKITPYGIIHLLLGCSHVANAEKKSIE